MNCCVHGLCCLCGPYPCCCLLQTRESTTTRLTYALIAIIVGVVCLSLYTDSKVNPFPGKDGGLSSICSRFEAFEDCYRLFTYVGIYRLCLTLFCFHILFALFNIGVSSSKSFRGLIHNGFWLFKILLLCGLWIAAFMTKVIERITLACTIVGVIGSFIFLYIQYVSLIDRFYELNALWDKKMHSSTCYKFLSTVISISIYLGAFSAYIVLFLLFGLPNKCILNMTFAVLNFFLTLLLAICSMASSKLRNKCLWLPGAFVSAFVAFITWSALLSQPKYYMRKSSGKSDSQSLKPLDPDESASVLMVVADELHGVIARNRLLGISNPDLDESASPSDTILNVCLPASAVSSGRLVDDILGIGLLVLIVAYSVHSGVSLSGQYSRFGWATKRTKLKRIFQQIDDAAKSGPDVELSSSPEKQQQMHIGENPSMKTASSEPNLFIYEDSPGDHADPSRRHGNRDLPQVKASNKPPIKTKNRLFRRFSTVRAERKLLKKLRKHDPSPLPDGVTPPPNPTATQVDRLDTPRRRPLPPAKRSRGAARLAPPDRSRPSDDVDIDGLEMAALSPDDIHYRRAQSLSDLAVRPDTTRVLKRRPHLANEFAFIKPLLSKDAPRDRFVIYNDAVAAVYSYSWFHFVLALCVLYIMTSITNWYKPEEAFFASLSGSWPNVYLKEASGLLALALCLWTTANLRFCFGRRVGGALTSDKPEK